MTNSADPDQLAFSEANRSRSTLFAKVGIYPGSAGLGLSVVQFFLNSDLVIFSPSLFCCTFLVGRRGVYCVS